MNTFVTALLGGIVGTLFTTFLTPRLQHHFWKHQRFEELRFTAITEVNRLVAEFSIHYLHGKDISEDHLELGAAVFQSWIIVNTQIKVLFSDSTYQMFDTMRLTLLTAPLFSKQEIDDRSSRIAELTRIHDAALRALYKEIGILTPSSGTDDVV